MKQGKNKAEKFWDRMADQFDKRSKYFVQPPVEKAIKYLNADDILLDFGCATGTVSIGIAGRAKEVLGIDISSKMIEAARRKAEKGNIENIDFKHAVIFDESLGRESFDVILAFNVLHFFDDLHAVMQRINELLKPGGLMISVTACMGEKTFSNLFQYIIFRPLIKLGIIPNIRFFKFSELESSIINTNFDILEYDSLDSNSRQHFIAAKKRQNVI